MWLLASCISTQLRGEIDGQPVDVQAAWMVHQPEAIGEDGLLTITLVTFPGGCSTAEFWGEQSPEATPEELAEAWAFAFPRNWWQIDVQAQTPGGRWPTDNTAWPGLRFGATPEATTVFAQFTHHTAHRDAAWFDPAQDVDPADYQTTYVSDQGALKWTKVVANVEVKGRFNTFVVGESEFLDTVLMDFTAPRCAGAGAL